MYKVNITSRTFIEKSIEWQFIQQVSLQGHGKGLCGWNFIRFLTELHSVSHRPIIQSIDVILDHLMVRVIKNLPPDFSVICIKGDTDAFRDTGGHVNYKYYK